MGKVTRKRHTAEFKARVALEAIKGEHTLAEIGAKYGVHLTLVAGWKKAAIDGMAATFSAKPAPAGGGANAAEVSLLHAKIGQLVVERDFLAKASGR
jgi:transposase